MHSSPETLYTIRQCMADTRLPRLELRMLLEHVLQRPRAWLLAHDDELLSSAHYQAYASLQQRRLAGEPMAYLLGRREFLDFEVKVAPGVLIPRPETELLVQSGLDSIQALQTGRSVAALRILDLGTGSGIVALALARACPQATVVATDFSAVALQIACDNAHALGVQVQFVEGSWFAPLADQAPFDLIVSNPPYIDVNDVHLSQGDLRFEPRSALTDGHDGLEDIRRIVQGSGAHLKPGGYLWLEHGFDQGAAVRDLLAQQGFTQIRTLQDLSGHERVSGGHRVCTACD